MRTLELNKSNLWYVEYIGEVEVLDEDGLYTGEVEIAYSEPKAIRLHLYPATGEVVDRTFGRELKLDMLTNSNEVLTEMSLLFLEKPVGNYEATYDYRVSAIMGSLNTIQYGLVSR